MNIAAAIRTALLANAEITTDLSLWKGVPSIHTRRPLPEDAGNSSIAISPDIVLSDRDFINSPKPFVVKDVIVYGQQPDDYRLVEEKGYLIRNLFHRKRLSLNIEGYRVVDITCNGPIPAPTDDVKTVARVVSLSILVQPTG